MVLGNIYVLMVFYAETKVDTSPHALNSHGSLPHHPATESMEAGSGRPSHSKCPDHSSPHTPYVSKGSSFPSPPRRAIGKLEVDWAREVSHHLAVGGSEAVGQFAQAVEVALEACQLGGRGVVGLTQRLAGVRLLLPQAGAEGEQQVTGQQLDHLQEPRCPGTHA